MLPVSIPCIKLPDVCTTYLYRIYVSILFKAVLLPVPFMLLSVVNANCRILSSNTSALVVIVCVRDICIYVPIEREGSVGGYGINVKEKLDRILANWSFRSTFLHMVTSALHATNSDHYAIIIDFQPSLDSGVYFKFEAYWDEREE
ncbi:hypothetical protein VNO77_24898 [Canavalia gladiata]|uniref:Uncharacterized protein n=1 Tax=Canavalia gladiata TaxID=3824 RepID=A0AAN9L756_CANGL